MLARLQLLSTERQANLKEFDFLRNYVDWFKDRQAQKLVSLNLVERRKQKEADDAFRKDSKLERDELAKADYPFKEFRLGAPLPPRIVAPKAADANKDGAPKDDDSDLEDTDDDANADAYGKVDVSLREALRVVNDAIDLGRNHEFWASDHAPLTVAAKG